MATNISWPQASLLGRLDGRVAVVTGAGAGIGRSVAIMLASAGVSVVVVDRDKSSVDQTCSFILEHGGASVAVVADVTDATATGSVLATTLEHFKRLDILVNNAGIYPSASPLPDIDIGTFEQTYKVNVYGTLNYICAAARRMEKGGSIINVSSNVSLRPAGPGIAHYSSSKAALNALTRAAAIDLAPLGIRVNAVLPGIVATEGTSALTPAFDYFAQRTPSGRIGDPGDIAGVVLFLASPASTFVNGQCLAVDGGASILG